MSYQEVLLIVGAGALASLLFGLMTTLCSRLTSGNGPTEHPEAAPPTSRESYDADEGLVRAAAGAVAEPTDHRSIIEEVAHGLRRELRREFERSFWAAIWVNFFFFLLGSATSLLLSSGFFLSR